MDELIYLILFYEFFKTGLFAVGGGLATLPFLSDMADRYSWLTHESLTDMIAISESTPGPLGVNMATWAGYQAAGVLGSLVATLALIAPSILVILLISSVLTRYQENRMVQSAFRGLRPAAAGLIAAACASVAVGVLFLAGLLAFHALNPKTWGLFLGLLVMMSLPRLKKLHPVVFIGIGAAIGILLQM